ncbi:BQ5605_C017g08490 [Microbotryum silenes-dioicae]|uniref:BQ5605_C017g08490 protein n=1 Tax=Microbotryum silenes-dioicae TaxID=796604 RepID=A0A2X0LV28_9BASI|nr:BQ5605_C017g08490 [Microbotryum silenes-dioicae]
MASGTIASPDLLWLLTKKHTSFQHKRVGIPLVFSNEKGNLKNVNAFKYSGLANPKTLHIESHVQGTGVRLVSRDPKASPFANASAYTHKGVKTNSGRKVAGRVAKHSGSEAGRLDLRSEAQSRASALLQSQNKDRKAQRTRATRGNKKAAIEA